MPGASHGRGQLGGSVSRRSRERRVPPSRRGATARKGPNASRAAAIVEAREAFIIAVRILTIQESALALRHGKPRRGDGR